MRATALFSPRRLTAAAIVVVLAAGIALAAARWLWPAPPNDAYSVVDGDTLAYRPQQCLLADLGIACLDQRLRLYGVDAFESRQTCRDSKDKVWPCGAVATARLKQLVARGDFTCSVDHEFLDRHAREFAVCTVGGEDVGAILVSEGLAFEYGRGSQYLPIEAEAKKERRGAWAGSFVRPQYFRERAAN